MEDYNSDLDVTIILAKSLLNRAAKELRKPRSNFDWTLLGRGLGWM